MEKVKRKFGFYIIASMCLLVSIFGIGVSSTFAGDISYSAAEGEEQQTEDKFEGILHYDGESFDEQLNIVTDEQVIFENSYFSDNAEISLTATDEILNDETVDTKLSCAFVNCYFDNASLIFGAISDVTFFNCVFANSGYIVNYDYAVGRFTFSNCLSVGSSRVVGKASSTANFEETIIYSYGLENDNFSSEGVDERSYKLSADILCRFENIFKQGVFTCPFDQNEWIYVAQGQIENLIPVNKQKAAMKPVTA